MPKPKFWVVIQETSLEEEVEGEAVMSAGKAYGLMIKTCQSRPLSLGSDHVFITAFILARWWPLLQHGYAGCYGRVGLNPFHWLRGMDVWCHLILS